MPGFWQSLKSLGKGNFARVYGNDEFVVKFPFPLDSPKSLRPWAKRIAHEQNLIMDRLRGDPAIRARFGDVFPSVRRFPSGVVLQDRVSGINTPPGALLASPDRLDSFIRAHPEELSSDVPPEVMKTAAEERMLLNTMARRVIDELAAELGWAKYSESGPQAPNAPEYHYDVNWPNFLHDPTTGRIIGFFDPVVTPGQIAMYRHYGRPLPL
jgi:hypothetical protein